MPVVVKFGGELLEVAAHRRAMAAMLAGVSVPLVVVHGGGREIDAALARAGLQKRQVDGLRVTDAPTMAVVVEVLAGAVNTQLVAAIAAAGGRPVGLTGADAGLVLVERAAPHEAVHGGLVDLGLVGQPVGSGRPALVDDLLAAGYLPVLCSIGMSADGALLNVNADTLAGHVAARLQASRLVIAGTTAGVLDGHGRTIRDLPVEAARALITSGVASAGMIAKLRACCDAIASGVGEVFLVDGREAATVASLLSANTAGADALPGTRMVA